MKTRNLWTYLFLFLSAVIFIAGCATHSVEMVPVSSPGFLKGLLHGFIILFSFIVSLFTEYKIYAIPNSGVFYDFGFLLGVMLFFGGSGAGARR